MPNWCEGSIKVRGRFEDVVKFFKEGIHCWNVKWENDGISEAINPDGIEYAPDEDYVEVDIKTTAHIDGTRRAFLDEQDIYIHKREDGNAIAVANIRQAWGFDTDSYAKISKNYDIDIRLYGFECGMCFNQEVEVIRGEVTIDNEIKFADYGWECPMPKMGG